MTTEEGRAMAEYFRLQAAKKSTAALHHCVRIFASSKRASLQMLAERAELASRTRGGIDCGCGWGDYCDDKDGCSALAAADEHRAAAPASPKDRTP